MNLNLDKYIADAKKMSLAHGLQWSIPLNAHGMAIEKSAWDLTLIAQAPKPPTVWLNDLGTDRVTVNLLNSETIPGPVRHYMKRALSTAWQDLIKASIIDHILVRKNMPSSALESIARPLRVLATCCGKCDPATITSEDIDFAMRVARDIQKCGKLADLVCGVVRSLLDANHLTDAGPLFPMVSRDQHVDKRVAPFAKAQAQLRDHLEERKRAERLPERRAFWELARIVFTEQPKSFLDAIRFAIIRLMILTGMRDGEVVSIPADWKRVIEYVDDCNRPAGESGGISREVKLRYFGEKQRITGKDSSLLFETSMTLPLRFAEIIENTLNNIHRITEPLRRTLERQIASGRILPQFHLESLVPAIDLYTILSGNPFVLKLDREVRRRFEHSYKTSFDPSVLREIRESQLERVRTGKGLITSVHNFLCRMEGVPVRDSSGREIDITALPRGKWGTAYYRVEDVENYVREKVTTKLSDSVPFRLVKGELQVHELLFLMPKRALCDTKEGGICDTTRCFSIGRFDQQMISDCLSKGRTTTLFSMYGKTDEDQKLWLRPHMP